MRGTIQALLPGAPNRRIGGCLLGLLAVPSLAESTEVYAKFSDFPTGIPVVSGESAATGRSGWTDIEAFSGGGFANASIFGGAVSSSTPNLQPLSFQKAADSLSPSLFAACTQGKAFGKLQVDYAIVYNIGGEPQLATQTKLVYNNVLVTDINWSGAGGSVVSESISCMFGSAYFQTRTLGPGGGYDDEGYLAYYNVVTEESTLGLVPLNATGTSPPQINPVAAKTVLRDSTGNSFNFSFTDADTDLTGLSADAVSISEGLIPDASVSVTGSGGTRTVQFSTADATGTATIQLLVSDDETTTPRNVTIYVVDPNAPPTIEAPSALVGCVGFNEPFTGIGISDPDTSSGLELVLSVDNGQLTLDTALAGGIQALQVSGNGTALVTVNASLSEINTTLGNPFGLLYSAASNSNAQLSLNLTDNDPVSPEVDSATVPITVFTDPYHCWQRRYFIEAEIIANLKTGELHDYEGDGTLNIIEFATGLDPTNPAECVPITAYLSETGEDTFLNVTYRRRIQPGSLSYSLELYDPATKTWDDGSSATNPVGVPAAVNPLIESVSWQITSPVATPGSLVRLKVLKL